MSSQIKQIAHRIAHWARSRNTSIPFEAVCGYCMSGSWHNYYQSFLFPGKMLHVERLGAIVQKLKQLGFRGSLDITPFDDGTGLYMYMRLSAIKPI